MKNISFLLHLSAPPESHLSQAKALNLPSCSYFPSFRHINYLTVTSWLENILGIVSCLPSMEAEDVGSSSEVLYPVSSSFILYIQLDQYPPSM